MDNAECEAHLAYLQAQADGPHDSFDLLERSYGKVLACAMTALLLCALGAWLVWLALLFGPQASGGVLWLLSGCGLGLVAVGLAALTCAAALYRRQGKRVLSVTPDTLCFANAQAPTPLHAFDGFEVEQGYFSTRLIFTMAASSLAPALLPTSFKGLASPDAITVAGGLRVRLWLCTPVVNGRRLDLQALVDLLYAYLQAAQARHTLAQLFPGVARVGVKAP
ncbi:hypothetical protein N8H41_12790 [Pseudomonas vlassakiae]|jgi:hypothetical protein|nr:MULTISPECIES: hypothetical protein [Pseudomonas]AXQ46983.1 hypothetical protein DZC31_05450 [Stenotrophomonas rhizophila]MBS3188769.1 hypothetical protein [Pseudomonas sp. PCH44]MCU0124849.1 hypothetical protein [Pseudomonas vlassakiae]PIK75486.1 hypothetical protein CQW31_26870 [Pseudomonas sp. 382]